MNDQELIKVIPSARQLALQNMEFYAFVHFTVNTFTNRGWGDGQEPESVFDPTGFDADQWVNAVRDAGMTGLILTCKHHDGFCLWPSAYTEHSVKNSPFRGGKGDVVREVSDACRRGGIAFGVYLSPWDRNQAVYGSGKDYDDYFVNQLTELLTGYGPVFSVWFDGACGEGPNDRKQYYDWDRYFALIRQLQPDACIHVCGPDIRWCGNEAGDTREAEWSVVPLRTRDTEKIASSSQKEDNDEFEQRKISARDRDLGSREILQNETELVWYPAEVNTSIRPGWFWREEPGIEPKPLEKLVDIYEKSVGGNATFLLNIPPDRRGLFCEADVQRLKELGNAIRDMKAVNLAPEAEIRADSIEKGHEVQSLLSDDDSWYAPEGSTCEITFTWPEEKTFRRVIMKEAIAHSQRVEGYAVDVLRGGEWVTAAEGRVIGYQRIVHLTETTARAVRVRITDSRVQPLLKMVGIYR